MPAFIKLILSGILRGVKWVDVLSWLALLVFLVGMLWLLIAWQPASAGALCPTSTPSHKLTPTPSSYRLYVPDVRTDCPEDVMCVTEATK